MKHHFRAGQFTNTELRTTGELFRVMRQENTQVNHVVPILGEGQATGLQYVITYTHFNNKSKFKRNKISNTY